MITVLFHHLASTGDPKILKRLFDLNYDPSIKNHIEENILHAFIRLNGIRRLNDYQISPNYKEALGLIVEYSQQIIDEKDILGFTSIAVAVDINDKSAVEVLVDRKADLNTKDIFTEI